MTRMYAEAEIQVDATPGTCQAFVSAPLPTSIYLLRINILTMVISVIAVDLHQRHVCDLG
jgi:hypothetical protein